MDTPQLALFALLVGVVLGGSVAAVVVAAYRARDRALVDASNDVPDGVRDVLAGMDDAAVVVDTSSTVVAASRAAIVFGMKEGTALPADELKELARTARNGTPSSAATLRLRRGSPPAEPRLVSVRSTAITPRLVLVIIRDITEQERVEEMRRDFVANTSHELKTPVGAVSLLAEAIESAADDPDQVRVFAARLQAEASRLASLTSRIMNLPRLQAADELTAMRDVAVSSGAACTSAEPEPSHVLRAMGLDEDMARASLRFGVGRFNTVEEIDHAIEVVAKAAATLRVHSAAWTGGGVSEKDEQRPS